VALFAAVVIQLTVVNRLPLPGATAPDLVLLLVAAIAVNTSPTTGAVTGFAGGLALDVAPPAAHYVGEYALVFCLVGYAAARVVRAIWDMTGEHDPITTFTVMAVAVAAGEAGKAALGMLLSDPNVTTAAVRSVLPGAVLYDLLLSPLVYWLVVRVTRGVAPWGAVPERAPAPVSSGAGQLAPVFRQASAVFRQASAGAAPKLRLAGTGGNHGNPSPPLRSPRLRLAGTGGNYASASPPLRSPKLRLAGTGGNYASASPPLRSRKLRLSDARARSSLATSAAASPGAPWSLAGGRTPKLNFAANRPPRATRSKARTPRKNWLRSAASPAAKRAPRSPSRGWLSSAGGGLAGGHTHGLAGRRTRGLKGSAFTGTVSARAAFAGQRRSAGFPMAARPVRSAEEALAARSAPSGLSALSGAGTPLAGVRSPQAGWLRTARGTSAVHRRRRSPRSGWLGSAKRPRTVIGSGVGSRGTRGNWYASSPSGAWLRRGRHPWRKRSQRLLRFVGVGR
jgi:rod shape-determining protein MreD